MPKTARHTIMTKMTGTKWTEKQEGRTNSIAKIAVTYQRRTDSDVAKTRAAKNGLDTKEKTRKQIKKNSDKKKLLKFLPRNMPI